jgi:hypothetical protein
MIQLGDGAGGGRAGLRGRTATVNDAVLGRQIDDERIARRAYEIYESRGRVDGYADDDWFRAASEYAARTIEAGPVDRYGASSSFGDRVRNARR